jgi:hypothetical protein
MDVEAEHCGDQQPASPLVVAPVIAAGSPISNTPASVSFAGKGSPVAAEAAAADAAATPVAAERVTTPVQVSCGNNMHVENLAIVDVICSMHKL